MPRRLLATLMLVLFASSCAAMGQWVYEDPKFALRDVRVLPSEEGADSLEILFIGCNLNDFDLTETSFSTNLKISGRHAGEGERVQTLMMTARDTARFSVRIPVEFDMLPARGTQPFEMVGQSLLKTPIGDRSVSLRLAGLVQRSGADLKWSSRMTSCRPGSSQLPGVFIARPLIREDAPPRNVPRDNHGGAGGAPRGPQ